MNSQMRLWAAAGIIAIVVGVGFFISVPRTQDVGLNAPVAETSVIPAVTVRDSYKKGVHTITGSLEAPNACTKISAESALTGDASTTQVIVVDIGIERSTGICLQLPRRMTFETKITAGASLPITVMVDGVLATTTPS